LPFAYGNLSFSFLRSNHIKVSATKLGPLTAQLPFTGSSHSFFKKKG